jgi:hypothetical protein
VISKVARLTAIGTSASRTIGLSRRFAAIPHSLFIV